MDRFPAMGGNIFQLCFTLLQLSYHTMGARTGFDFISPLNLRLSVIINDDSFEVWGGGGCYGPGTLPYIST